MNAELAELREWLQGLPASQMVYPDATYDRVKYHIWRVITPIHPYVRDILLSLGIIYHSGRQRYSLGFIAPHSSVKKLVTHLVSNGYGNHFVAWVDDGELISLRYTVDFRHQYHIRIFSDWEVRAHFEYTPECHPLLHMREEDVEHRREEFLALLREHILTHQEAN